MEERTEITLASEAITLAFRYEHGLVLFDGTGANGESLVVELDTCTSPNAVRDSLACERGWQSGSEVASRGFFAECQYTTHEAEVPLLRLGDIEIRSLYAHTDPLGGPAAPDIMLGEWFLREVVVRLDYAHQCATFFRADSWTRPSVTRDRVVLELDVEIGGVPCLRDHVSVDGVKAATALVDTGFNDGVLLSPSIAEALGIGADFEGVRHVIGGGYGGPASFLKTHVAVLTIGPIKLHSVPAYLPSEGTEAPFRDEMWVNLGNRVLEHFAVTWAIPSKTLVLERTQSPASFAPS